MRHYRHLVSPIVLAVLTGCSSSSEVIRYSGNAPVEESPAAATNPAAQAETQRVLAEQRAREAAERLASEEAARQAEQARRAELARAEAEEAVRREAETRRREQAAREAERAEAERQQAARARAARELAEQQARVEELQARIAATNASAATFDEANLALRDAVAAAENLVQALSVEQGKYAETDPATGTTSQPLDRASIDTLQREVDRLKAQADMLMGQVEQ